MIKTSVKKPFTVLVAVIMIIALGFVSLSSMTLDLLPEFSLPYMIVITTYPGAGPEKVESMVSSPMESALGTISGVKNISSTSSENASVVQLEFEDGTDMASVLVKVSNAINSVKSYLPAEAGTPNILEISMDMMATDYLGVSYEGKDMYFLSDFVEDELVPYLERQDGVADIRTIGLVKKSIQVEVDKAKLDDLNDRILALTDKGFADAYKQITDGRKQLVNSQKEIDDGWKQLEEGKQALADGKIELQKQKDDFTARWEDYRENIGSDADNIDPEDIENFKEQIDAFIENQFANAEKQLEDAEAQLETAAEQLREGQKAINDGWKTYNNSLKKFEKQREQTRNQANANQLVDVKTLASLIYAQNFEMPAGYIDDTEDNSWLLKIGQSFDSEESLGNTILTNIKDIGDVRLSDIATLTTIDTAGESYAKMNGEDAILISVFKGSTASTNAVSGKIKEASAELEKKFPGLKITTLMDQGEYINILTKSVLESMLIGAVLAIFILAIFLKDFKPTLVVAVSIPLSVLLAIVCMYFANISLNMMTLAGMALGIGMHVDNSIVVIENIYRLRTLGYSAAQAAVTGTKQVAAPIIASTITTVCVFVPILFANGLVKDLILPLCLTVTFCLTASLVIAMTLVPAAGSTLLKNSKEKSHSFFDKLMDGYGKALDWCLKVKIVPMALAIALLALSVFEVMRMGIIMIPGMSTEPISVNVRVDNELEKEDAFHVADKVMEAMMNVEGVETVGAMPSNVMSSLVSSTTQSANPHRYLFYIMLKSESPTGKEIERVKADINNAIKDIEGVKINVSSTNMDTSALMGSGLTVNIFGNNTETLMKISEDVKEIVAKVPGYTNIKDDQEEGDEVIHLVIDKDAAMLHNMTVAQIYQELSAKMTTETSSVTLEVSGRETSVKIINKTSPITLDNLLDYTFNIKETDEEGSSVINEYKLSEFAHIEKLKGVSSVNKQNLAKYISISASLENGYNATLLSRQLQPLLDDYNAPDGYRVEIDGESNTVNDMVIQMSKMLALGFLFIYLVMVAQFQSLLSPFIILFTIPLAFTGGLLALWMTKEQLSIMSLMGFLILMGTVVNNGIVFVDYTNRLRIEGMERREALIETGKTRMRPILMTALTTILAMAKMVVGSDMASQMGKGMSLVIMGGLLYATLMTLFIVPVVYDILFKKPPLNVNVE